MLQTILKFVGLVILLAALVFIAQEVAGVGNQGPSASAPLADFLIQPGMKAGPLRLDQTQEEALKVFPTQRVYGYANPNCGATNLLLGARDAKGGFQLWLKDDKVFQIRSYWSDRYHTARGLTYGSDPELIREEFPQMESYTRPDPDSRTGAVLPRTRTYWVDQNSGIAFELEFDPRVWGYRISKIVVFRPHTDFYVDGCPPPIEEKLVSLGPFGLPPAGAGVKLLRSVASETVKDEAIDRAVRKLAEKSRLGEFKPWDRYLYNKVDLTGDGVPEVLVYLAISCGSAGCQFLVMQKKENDYEVISDIAPIKNPVIVSQERTNGWNNLIFWFRAVDVTGYAGEVRVLKFDGKTYPYETEEITQPVEGTRYLDNPDELQYGIRLGN